MKHFLRLALLTVLVFLCMSAYVLVPRKNGSHPQLRTAHFAPEPFGPRRLRIFLAPEPVERISKARDRKAARAGTPAAPGEGSSSRLRGKPGKKQVEMAASETPRKRRSAGLAIARAAGKPQTARKVDPRRVYIVKKGDTLSQIAQKMLGSTRFVKDILRENPAIRDGNKLRVGQALVLPVELTGAEEAPEENRAHKPKSREAQVDSERFIVVTVRKGDTLFGIAKRYLGSGARWRDLLTLNANALKGKKVLIPGLRLLVPRKNQSKNKAQGGKSGRS